MKFNEFANRLYPIIGAGSSTHAFSKSLFDAIISDEGKDILEESQPDTYKAYFNGNTGISRFAKKVTAYIDRVEFEDYLDGFSDEASIALCHAFSDCFPDADSRTISQQIAELFVQIIREAACPRGARKKEKGPSEDEPEIIEAEVVDGERPSDTACGQSVTIIQNQTIIEHDESKTFHIDNSTVTFNL